MRVRRIRGQSLAAAPALLLVAFSLALGGCAGMYFSDAGPPPAPVRYELAHLPFSEYWTGIVFNGEKAPLDVFSALDVLASRRAECQGHAYLYAALARAAGIPTRVVNGLAYSEAMNGFLYHSWAESLLGFDWIGVDPTLGQTPTDATHIKLIEGEQLADLVPLLDWAGRVKIRVLAVESPER